MWKSVERSNVLCVADVMADYFAYVQLPIQSVSVDQPLGTKNVKPLPVLHVILQHCVTRNSATLRYTGCST